MLTRSVLSLPLRRASALSLAAPAAPAVCSLPRPSKSLFRSSFLSPRAVFARSCATTDPRKDGLHKLLGNNKEFVAERTAADPRYFKRLAKGQQPKYLFIGCSDSRVPPNELTKTEPGELFIHRNIANLVIPSDTNCMAVVQYAIFVLKVTDVIIMGHYGCGGVAAALGGASFGQSDKWLVHIKDVYRLHKNEVDSLPANEKEKRMVELNVIEQVINLYKSNIMQKAWSDGLDVSVHGVVCDIETGLMHDLEVEKLPIWQEVQEVYKLKRPTSG